MNLSKLVSTVNPVCILNGSDTSVLQSLVWGVEVHVRYETDTHKYCFNTTRQLSLEAANVFLIIIYRTSYLAPPLLNKNCKGASCW